MKRKKFIQTVGIGIFAVSTATTQACKKAIPAPPSKSKPNVDSGEGVKEPEPINSGVIDGYTDKLSYLQGETIKVYVNGKKEGKANIILSTPNGLIKKNVLANIKPQIPGPDPSVNGYQYELSFSFTITPDLPSGLYYWENCIPFIIKNGSKNGDMVVVMPSNTDNAYNTTGGLGSYTSPMAPILSYQRPYVIRSWSESFWPWAETLGYNIDYIVDQDLDDYETFSYSKLLIIPGHNEYWTRKARINFDKFINSGKNSLILSGNTMWWQIRYSEDKTKMICYKIYKDDPIDDLELKTDLWTTRSLKYPIENSIGVNFNLGGFGDNNDKGWNGYKIVNQNSPLLRGTGLKDGDIISCLSQEYDGTYLKFEKDKPYPVIDNRYKFHKIELIGFDYGFRFVETVGAFIALQRTKTSGVIVNTASTDWCSNRGMGGPDGATIKIITLNAINLLVSGSNVFSS